MYKPPPYVPLGEVQKVDMQHHQNSNSIPAFNSNNAIGNFVPKEQIPPGMHEMFYQQFMRQKLQEWNQQQQQATSLVLCHSAWKRHVVLNLNLPNFICSQPISVPSALSPPPFASSSTVMDTYDSSSSSAATVQIPITEDFRDLC